MISSGVLDNEQTIRHAFFIRQGGVSEGVFASLNCGFGSGNSPEKVTRNRAIAMHRLGLSADRLVTCRQIHSAAVVTVERAWRREEAPEADGLVTRAPGIALGVLAADCAPILLCDPTAKVIGAAHGGWRGVLAGVAEATIAKMEMLGAVRGHIEAAIGPCIAQRSYEVGPEFPLPFMVEAAGNSRFFAPAQRPGHSMFDLKGYIAHRFARAGIAAVDPVPHDTFSEEDRFFSYRRARLRGEPAYGRGLSAIVLAE